MFGFFDGIGDKVGEKVIEKTFISMIEGFTIKDLNLAVKEDISLLDQTQICNPRALAFAERVAKQFNGQKDLLTLENVLVWTKRKRDDLYWHFMADFAAKSWLDRQVREFRQFLFDY